MLIYHFRLHTITGELGDYDARIMHDCSYVSEFRFIPDQVCKVDSSKYFMWSHK